MQPTPTHWASQLAGGAALLQLMVSQNTPVQGLRTPVNTPDCSLFRSLGRNRSRLSIVTDTSSPEPCIGCIGKMRRTVLEQVCGSAPHLWSTACTWTPSRCWTRRTFSWLGDRRSRPARTKSTRIRTAPESKVPDECVKGVQRW